MACRPANSEALDGDAVAVRVPAVSADLAGEPRASSSSPEGRATLNPDTSPYYFVTAKVPFRGAEPNSKRGYVNISKHTCQTLPQNVSF